MALVQLWRAFLAWFEKRHPLGVCERCGAPTDGYLCDQHAREDAW